MRILKQGGIPPMKQQITAREVHALYCPLTNTKSALFLVAFSAWETLTGWMWLHKPLAHPDLVELPFFIIVAVLLARWAVSFTCFRERLVFGLVITYLAVEEVSTLLPVIAGPHVHLVRCTELVLWILCLLVSLTMLLQSARTPKVELSEQQAATQRQLRRNFVVAFVLMITIIVLLPLVYFLPPGWVQWITRLFSS